MAYWSQRILDEQDILAQKSIKQIEKQLSKYYKYSMR